MIYLPKLNEISRERTVLSTFGGLDRRAKTPEGFFSDSNNLSTDHYPLMATRGKQSLEYKSGENVDCILASDTVYFTRGNVFFRYIAEDGEFLDEFGFGDANSRAKQLVQFGAYVIILSDDGKLYYYNTLDESDSGAVDIPVVEISNFNLYGTDESGKEPEVVAPSNAQIGDMYLSTTYDTIYRYDGSSWVTLSDVKTAISGRGIGRVVRVGDYIKVNISGEKDPVIGGMYGKYYSVVSVVDDDLIVIDYDNKSNYTMAVPLGEHITISNFVPMMDYIAVANNRLWGCRYDGEVNEIYASKLGNFRVFNDLETFADSSYAMSLGSSGAFTGASSYQGYPIFFKENYIHRIAGTLPENFTLQTTECQGVKEGSYRSVTVSNERLYFHGLGGVYAYDGNLPVKISDELGASNFSNATGGVHDNKLYMNMSDGGVYATYVYDLSLGLWHKQNEGLSVNGFASYKDDMLCTTDQGILSWYGKSVFPGYFPKLPFTWYAETGIIGTDAPGAKYLARMIIRISMEIDATMTIYVEYDSIPEWIPLTTISGDSLKSFSIPLSFDRCDHLRLRFEGKGEAKIYTITKDIEKGGEER